MITHKKAEAAAKTILDLIICWLIFLWKDGYIWGTIQQFGLFLWKKIYAWLCVVEGILQDMGQGIVFITPLGRTGAEKIEIQYMLVVGGVCAMDSLLFYWWTMLDFDIYKHKLTCAIVPIFCAFVIWYSSYLVALLVNALSVNNYILMMGIIILSSIFVGSLLYLILFGIRRKRK